MRHLAACIFLAELPVHRRRGFILMPNPAAHFRPKCLKIWYASREALPGDNGNLVLGKILPRSMDRQKDEPDAGSDSLYFVCRIPLLKVFHSMCVVIVQNDCDRLSALIQHIADTGEDLREISRRSPGPRTDSAAAGSVITKSAAAPLRLYSASMRSTFQGVVSSGARTSPRSCSVFSSRQMTGCSGSYGFA